MMRRTNYYYYYFFRQLAFKSLTLKAAVLHWNDVTRADLVNCAKGDCARHQVIKDPVSHINIFHIITLNHTFGLKHNDRQNTLMIS